DGPRPASAASFSYRRIRGLSGREQVSDRMAEAVTTRQTQTRPHTDVRRLFRARLLRWYDRHRRELPWRDSRDPYRVWLSEIMLQQTRVNAVVAHYKRFV